MLRAELAELKLWITDHFASREHVQLIELRMQRLEEFRQVSERRDPDRLIAEFREMKKEVARLDNESVSAKALMRWRRTVVGLSITVLGLITGFVFNIINLYIYSP